MKNIIKTIIQHPIEIAFTILIAAIFAYIVMYIYLITV